MSDRVFVCLPTTICLAGANLSGGGLIEPVLLGAIATALALAEDC